MTRVAFSTTDSLLGKLIRAFTKAEVSHTLLIVNLEGKDRVIQADWNGVVVTPLDVFMKQNRIVCSINVGDTIRVSDALDMADTPYDYEGFVGMAWVSLGRWFKRRWKNPWHSSKALFCSEMAAILLQKGAFPGADKLDPASTSPQDLMDFLVEHVLDRAGA